MPIISQDNPAQTLLAQLQQAYPTPHVDTQEEQRDNLRILEQALKDGEKPELLVAKIRAINEAHGQRIRYKLSTLIVGTFWNQRLEQNVIIARGYEVPKPREIKGFSLEP